MDRMKTFFIYLILFIAFFMFVSVMSKLYVKSSYKNINTYEVVEDGPKLVITESKATSANGYIIGKIKNNTGENIDKTNMVVNFYSPRGINLGTKVVKIEDFKQNEIKEFRVNYELNNVANYKIAFATDDVLEHEGGDIFDAKTKTYWVLGGLLAAILLLT